MISSNKHLRTTITRILSLKNIVVSVFSPPWPSSAADHGNRGCAQHSPSITQCWTTWNWNWQMIADVSTRLMDLFFGIWCLLANMVVYLLLDISLAAMIPLISGFWTSQRLGSPSPPVNHWPPLHLWTTKHLLVNPHSSIPFLRRSLRLWLLVTILPPTTGNNGPWNQSYMVINIQTSLHL